MKYLLSLGLIFASLCSFSQEATHISKLELGKKEKKLFNRGDSSEVIHIDTLIMKDRSKIEFFAKKDIKLIIGYAEIGENVVITGQDGKNNATNLDIEINFKKLGSLFVISRGIDAMNGTKTFPNGNGGNVKLQYANAGLSPQMTDKKAKKFLYVDANPGGLRNNPIVVREIYSRISMTPSGIIGLPQGQVYSGSPGTEGKVTVGSY